MWNQNEKRATVERNGVQKKENQARFIQSMQP